jgi:hypothetical protein
MDTNDLKSTVGAAFDAWAAGTGNVFDLLADDVQWTIAGTSPVAGTYTSRRDFTERALVPINARLAGPIHPEVRAIYADGDTVIVHWQGHTTATDGQPYDNTYCWIMRFAEGKVVEVTAWFDSTTLADLFERVPI